MVSSLLVFLALASLTFVVFKAISKRGRTLPPGPKGLPIVGNLFDIAHLERPAETFAKWAETYGDVMSFSTYGHTTIILNTAKAAVEVLERRSQSFSSRPRFMYVNEMMKWSWEVGHLPYGDSWRFHRRVFHQYFQPSALPNYHEFQTRAAVSIMSRLSQTPADFHNHLRVEFGRAILKAVYGYEAQPENDPFVALSDQAAMHLGTAMQPGRFLADYFEFLKYVPAWFPGAFYKRYAIEGAALTDKMRTGAFEITKAAVADGTAGHSFVADALTRYQDFSDDSNVVETAVKSNAASALVAGADTTTSASMTFILAMCLNPDMQRKAQEEIDRVVGHDRLPTFADRENMPYLEAALIESLRWLVVTPLGAIPHSPVEDEEYNGFLIPKGASLFPNVWAILHDPVAYPKPHSFNPDRFYPSINKDTLVNPDPRQFSFGLGRRICPGRYFALDAIWSVVANLIACYDILPSLDEDGKEVMPVADWTGGPASFPKPYTCRFLLRSEEKAKLIAMRYEEVNGL